MSQSTLQWAAIVSDPFGENTYIAQLRGRSDCIIVDPGLEPDKIFTHLDQNGLAPAAILITHGHSDHIAGNGALKERYPSCPIVASHGDAEKLLDPELNLSRPFGFDLYSPPADVLLGEGDTYSAAGIDLLVREIPGHSSGHVVFIWQAGTPAIVFGGDVLFAGSIGRTDFPGCSFEELVGGIWSKLFTLPDDTQVLPGHGPPTTVGQEKRANPFVGAPAGFHG